MRGFLRSMKRAEWLAMGSIGVGVVVLALKFVAYWLTGSLALYSDALESIINVVAAGCALLAVRVAAKPADEDHPFGHHKAEYVSAALEGSLIVLAAAVIVHDAVGALILPRPLEIGMLAVGVNVLASVLNGAWCWVLLREGRSLRSAALVADGKHLLMDVFSSMGVLVGVLLAWQTGWHMLDPLLALAVGVNIVWSGFKLVRDSVGGLMDEAVPQEVLARIQGVLEAHMEGVLEVHDVRTRHAGRATFIEFHLVVDGGMTVRDSHAICDRMEEALSVAVEDAVVTIHVEPEVMAKRR